MSKLLDYLKTRKSRLLPCIKCKDGFIISVQANHNCYCSPRFDDVDWYEVECGYPSKEPEFIMEYAEDVGNPTGTIYAYVPIELVEKLLELHGGF